MSFSWGKDETKFFFELTPDRVVDAVESTGIQCTGRCMALNSMENRVYEVEREVEDDSEIKTQSDRFRIVKFYRPGRWNEAQILAEHLFLSKLQSVEVPVVAPELFEAGKTLKQLDSGIYCAVFPKFGGRAPDELTPIELEMVGRLIGRIHNVGASLPKEASETRIRLEPNTYGRGSLQYLLESKTLPLDLESRYQDIVTQICDVTDPWFQEAKFQAIHGDCHPGNLLRTPQGFTFLDFDDMVRGPQVQDLWLIVRGRDEYSVRDFQHLLNGYVQMRSFDPKELRLIEPLRALRFIHFNAWIAKRWEDPAFPRAFPDFGSHRYWSETLSDLEEQLRIIQSGLHPWREIHLPSIH